MTQEQTEGEVISLDRLGFIYETDYDICHHWGLYILPAGRTLGGLQAAYCQIPGSHTNNGFEAFLKEQGAREVEVPTLDLFFDATGNEHWPAP